LPAMAAGKPTKRLDGVYIQFCGNGHLWFRPYGDSLFQTPKSKQKALPRRPAPRLGSAYLRSGPAPWASRHRPSMPGCPLRRTSTQPPEGAGGSKSKTLGELTLGLLSGEELRVYSSQQCGSGPARDDGHAGDVFPPPGCTRHPNKTPKKSHLSVAFLFSLISRRSLSSSSPRPPRHP
jgi:hypothetical protein